ncbi:putative short-chain dehydrogenase [Colletotrichum truncatum]|uniref:Short-chain dehydrogenase n=1 Tax=Colletotrichum truncatum TaxID=5467 RepID=A0ACC3ZD19_COLTU|nr:putative short-chain dehydrogenase [Colletotrichum truncatum]KAF6797969.1 putative short-chain dehydrogenase [Colletotrichum truncatum]
MGIFNVLLCASAVSAYTVTNVGKFMLKNIDPVVVPGEYTSHMHTFFGSDAVTVNTTTSKELQAGCATAENPNDFSSYWVPTLYVNNGTSVFPAPIFRFSAYYVSIEKAEVAIPQNYKAVVGNAEGKSQDDVEPLAGIQWFCDHGGQGTNEGKNAAEFPSKGCPAHLQTILLFHDCVNESTLESTYSGVHHWTKFFKPANRCPEGMKRMPQLRFSIRYDLRKVLPDGWDGPAPLELSCGSSYCTHGDFINGWLPEAAENMLKANSKRDFAGVDGPAGKYNAGSVCNATAVDADPENGTADYETSKKILKELAQ